MTWLTLRQLRTQAATVASVAAALVAVLLLTTPRLVRMYAEGHTTFLPRMVQDGGLQSLYYAGCVAVLALPAVIGVFWGAPLVAREVETGTHRLIWTQTVSRTGWLATKLLVVGGTAVGVTAALSLAMTRWADPIDAATRAGGSQGPLGVFELSRMSPVIFDTRGVAPIGFATFAFALGVVAGAVVRRTVPAMAITLALFVAVQVAVPLWVRPHLAAPVETRTAITADNLHGLQLTGDHGQTLNLVVDVTAPGGWLLANQTVGAGGRVVTPPAYAEECLGAPIRAEAGTSRQPVVSATSANGPSPAVQACFARLHAEGYTQRVVYQPASRYWSLQWRELALYLAAAGLLAGLSFRAVRRVS